MWRSLFGWLLMLGGGSLLLFGCCGGLLGGYLWLRAEKKAPAPPRPLVGDPRAAGALLGPEGRALQRAVDQTSEALEGMNKAQKQGGQALLGAGAGLLLIGLLGVWLASRLLARPTAPTPPRAPWSDGQRIAAWLGGLTVVLVVGGVVWFRLTSQRPPAANTPTGDARLVEAPFRTKQFRNAGLTVAVSPDGDWIAVNEIGAIQLLHQGDPARDFALADYGQHPEFLVFAGNRYLVSGHILRGMAGELMVWGLEARQRVARRPWSSPVARLAGCGERGLVALTTRHNDVLLFSVPALEGKGQVSGVDRSFHQAGLAFFPGGKRLATSDTRGQATVYTIDDVGNLLPARTGPDLGGTLPALAVNHDGTRLAVGKYDRAPPHAQRVLLLDAQTLAQVHQLEAPAGPLAFSPDGRELAVGAVIYDTKEWKERQVLRPGQPRDAFTSVRSNSVAYGAKGQRLALAQGYVSALNVATVGPRGFGLLTLYQRK